MNDIISIYIFTSFVLFEKRCKIYLFRYMYLYDYKQYLAIHFFFIQFTSSVLKFYKRNNPLYKDLTIWLKVHPLYWLISFNKEKGYLFELHRREGGYKRHSTRQLFLYYNISFVLKIPVYLTLQNPRTDI